MTWIFISTVICNLKFIMSHSLNNWGTMRAFSLKRTAACYLLLLVVVAFEVLRQVVDSIKLWQVVAFWIYWRVFAYGKLSLMASCRSAVSVWEVKLGRYHSCDTFPQILRVRKGHYGGHRLKSKQCFLSSSRRIWCQISQSSTSALSRKQSNTACQQEQVKQSDRNR